MLRGLGELVAVSSLYRTAPWGKTDQPAFVNAVAALDTHFEARALLRALHEIEHRLGREESHERWGPRPIDLDILLFGDQRIDEAGLTVPHLRLRERAFALVPLAEIAPQYAAMRDALSASDRAGVQPIG